MFRLKDYFRLENFIISHDAPWKTVFDTVIVIIVGYSCFTTVFYVTFNKKQILVMQIIDHGVTITFTIDFILHFFQEYQDKDTSQLVRDPYKIALKYMKGWMFMDFIATFPFDLLYDKMYTKMIRLARLTKLINLMNINRVKALIKSYYEKSQRADRAQSQYIVIYSYKIFRLVVIIFIITYFIGCFWWLAVQHINSADDVRDRLTFITYFGLDQVYYKEGLCDPDICEEALEYRANQKKQIERLQGLGLLAEFTPYKPKKVTEEEDSGNVFNNLHSDLHKDANRLLDRMLQEAEASANSEGGHGFGFGHQSDKNETEPSFTDQLNSTEANSTSEGNGTHVDQKSSFLSNQTVLFLEHIQGNDLRCKAEDWKAIHCNQESMIQVISVLYYALTTLSTIGYGDLYPISNMEMILGIVVMLIGIVFFS